MRTSFRTTNANDLYRRRSVVALHPIVLAVSTLVLLQSSSRAGTPDISGIVVHSGVSEPARAWRAAVEAGDLATLAAMHDNATIEFPPDKTKVAGRMAIMKDYAQLFARYQVRVTYAEAHWCEHGPLVVSWGLSTLTLHPKVGGADKVTHTRFTDAAVKMEDGWRYVVDHASVATP